jgi:pSer/pThr/pTyr-binding forkhead associated (FHA) protein
MPEIVVKLGDNVICRYSFDKDIISIGRSRDNDIVIENLSVSRNHARIRRQDGKYIITDLNSANGTLVNGVRITKTEIIDEDVITVGKHSLEFLAKVLSEDQVISDAFGSDRTMIVDKAPIGCLTVIKGKQKDEKFKIAKYETYLGRASDNDVRLHDWFVSKRHAVIIRQGKSFFLKDLGSWKGTLVNGKYTKEAQLFDNDTLQFGTTQLGFHLEEEEVPKITGRVPRELVHQGKQAEGEAESVVVSTEGIETEHDDEPEAELQVGFERLEEERESGQAFEDEMIVQEKETIPDEVQAQQGAPEPEQEVAEEEMPLQEEKPTEEIFIGQEEPIETAEAYSENPTSPHPGVSTHEIQMWERALQNKSAVIRKQAAKMLKKLTGRDYEC